MLNIGKLVFKTEKAKYRFIKKYTEIISRYGYKSEQISKEIQLLSQQFNKEASLSDVIWSLFNKALLSLSQSKTANLEKISYLYFDMSVFLAESGENPSSSLEEAHKYKLMHLQKRWSRVRISSGNGCESCSNFNDKIYSIDVALKEKILPNKDCSSHSFKTSKYPRCSCYFVAVINSTNVSK